MSTSIRAIRGLIRALACLLGAFLIVSGTLDILGLMAYSTETPPLRHRLLKDLPLMLAAAVLLVPMRPFTRGVPYAVLKVAYVALSLVCVAKLADGVAGYGAGRLSWHVIPTTLLLAAIIAANAIVLWSMPETKPGAA